METDYGYGLTVDWTPTQIEKIRRYKAEHLARRLLGHPTSHMGWSHYYVEHPQRRHEMAQLAATLYKVVKAGMGKTPKENQ